jgi:hypothetical protein
MMDNLVSYPSSLSMNIRMKIISPNGEEFVTVRDERAGVPEQCATAP